MERNERPVRNAVQLIAKEAEEAGCNQWDVLKLIKALDVETEKNVDDLRKKTVELLQQINPQAAAIYASFNRLHVFTSAQRIEPFDRGNIIKSLLRETDVTRGVAEKIGAEVEDKVKDLKINYLNTSLIREMADVRLLEYGHEAIHQQYARIGMPVYEVHKRLENAPFDNPEILSEYHWLQIIPARERELHFAGDLYLSCVEDFSTRPFAFSLEPTFSGNSFPSALVELAEQFARVRHFSSLPLNLNALNFMLARQLPKGKKKLLEAARLLCRALNTLYPVPAAVFARPAVGLDLFVREHLESFSRQENQALEFANAFLQAYHEDLPSMRFDVVLGANTKYQPKLLDNRLFSDCALHFLNCRNAELRPFNGFRSSDAEALCFDGALNVLKQAVSYPDNRKGFETRLSELAASLATLAAQKAELLKSRVYLHPFERQLSSAAHVLDLFGLFDAPRALRPTLSDKEYAEDAQAFLSVLLAALPDPWVFSAQRHDVSTRRFTDLLRERYNYVPESRKTQEDFRRFNASAKKRLVLRNTVSTRTELEECLNENTRLTTFRKKPAEGV